MAYITEAQAKQVLGKRIYESAYINVSTDTYDETILTEDIAAVSAVIDGYLKRIYNTTPTGAASLALLKSIAEALIKRKAYERYDEAELPESVVDAADKAVFRLRDIADGKLPLPDEDVDIQADGLSYAFNTGRGNEGTSNNPVFTRSKMAGC